MDVLSRAVLVFCKLMYKSLSLCHSSVMAADIYEDDDYYPSLNPPLDHTLVDESVVIMELESVIEELKSLGEDEEAEFICQALTYRRAAYDFHKANNDLVSLSIPFKNRFKNAPEDEHEVPDFESLGKGCLEATQSVITHTTSLLRIVEKNETLNISTHAGSNNHIVMNFLAPRVWPWSC